MTSRTGILALFASAALLLAGCAAIDTRDGARTIDVGGIEREYLLYVPEALAAEPSLVVFLHGGFGSASQAEAAYGWSALADREGIIVAYPQGDGAAWNAGSCCGAPSRDNVDDVGFISTMVRELQAEFGIAPERTFATGMSNGAMMAYRMACESEVFSAVAPVAGTIVTECAAARPASVLQIHGLDDERVRYDGETGSGVTRVDGLAVEDAVALWRATDECGQPVIVQEPPVTTSAADCADGHRVQLITIADAGHQWPGADSTRVADPDAVSNAIDATELIWEFFDQ